MYQTILCQRVIYFGIFILVMKNYFLSILLYLFLSLDISILVYFTRYFCDMRTIRQNVYQCGNANAIYISAPTLSRP